MENDILKARASVARKFKALYEQGGTSIEVPDGLTELEAGLYIYRNMIDGVYGRTVIRSGMDGDVCAITYTGNFTWHI